MTAYVFKINLDVVDKWSETNCLPLNCSKCHIMTYTRRLSTFHFDYSMSGNALKELNCVKDVGVIFDPKLSFKQHITNIPSSAYKSLSFVIRNSKGLRDIDFLKILYCAFVRVRLEYASIIWNPIYNVQIDSLEKIQRFLKYCNNPNLPPNIAHALSVHKKTAQIQMNNLANDRERLARLGPTLCYVNMAAGGSDL